MRKVNRYGGNDNKEGVMESRSMNVFFRIILKMGIAIICMSCFCAPVYYFTDSYYLPKFYLFVIGTSFFLISLFLIEPKEGIVECLSDYLSQIYIIFIIMAECECAYIVTKILIYGRSLIGEFGTFDNPAGLALTLSIAISMIITLLFKTNKWRIKFLLYVGSIPVVSILLITNSRTGLICLALNVIILFWFLIHRFLNYRTFCKVFFLLIAAVLFLSVVSYVTSIKSDSTIGRRFILEQSFSMIEKHPIVGYGSNGFQSEYMLQQAKFFRENPNSIYENNADEVRYPMNEFVYIWINYGIGGLLLLVSVFLFPLILFLCKKGIMIQKSLFLLIPVLLFSFFSYPFHYQSSWLVLLLVYSPIILLISKKISISFNSRICSVFLVEILFILYLSVDIYHEYQWGMAEKLSFRGYHQEALSKYGSLHGYFHGNRFFLYSYAMAAFMSGDMQTAHRVISECGQYWNGYARELLSGDICLYMNEYEEASEHFNEAHFMCPVRFAPLEGLYKVYDLTDNDFKKDSIAKLIATKYVKVESNDVERIKETCK